MIIIIMIMIVRISLLLVILINRLIDRILNAFTVYDLKESKASAFGSFCDLKTSQLANMEIQTPG